MPPPPPPPSPSPSSRPSLSASPSPSPARPTLGHVVLNGTDLSRSVPFYVEALGLRVVGRTDPADRDRIGDIVFLSFGDRHHDVALRQIPAGEGAVAATPRDAVRAGLAHVAFRCAAATDGLAGVVRRLVRAGATGLRAVDHGATRSVYFEDPDGLALEAYAGDDALPDGPLSIVARPLPIDPSVSPAPPRRG